jgi:hypothetical protein
MGRGGAGGGGTRADARFERVKGSGDQAAGLVFRYRDKDNYCIVRANALEENVVLYRVENGKRTDLKPRGAGALAYGKKARVPSGSWSLLRVVDSVTYFDDLEIAVLE